MNTILPDAMLLPARTLTGAGIIQKLPEECARFGKRGLLVHGRSLRQGGVCDRILQKLPAGVAITVWEHAGGEPTLNDLIKLLAAARKQKVEWIAGVGGGSVLDVAKAAAGLFNGRHPVQTYHDGQAVETPGIPFVAAPTTAGTGSEATLNSVLTNTETRRKKSIRDPFFMARLVLLDPDLLATCPPAVIAQSGLDALTQAIESYTSRYTSWISDAIALEGIRLIGGNLEAVYRGKRGEAALNLMIGSYFGGIGLALARLGVVHGLAHPLGVRYHAPHGLVCGLCLPHALELNRPHIGDKYERMCGVLGGDLLAILRGWLKDWQLPSPFAGQPLPDADAIIRETLPAWSTQANPKAITEADVRWLLDRLFET